MNKQFWVPQGRSLCRELIRHCTECRRIHATKRDQNYSDLPEFRLPQSPENHAFSTVGIDAFGPFTIKVARTTRNTAGIVKRWVIIFTCAQYRGIHLEVVHDISTDAFLNAFTRFLARRPRPRLIITDRGTNFIGCRNLLRSIERDIERIENDYQSIEWR